MKFYRKLALGLMILSIGSMGYTYANVDVDPVFAQTTTKAVANADKKVSPTNGEFINVDKIKGNPERYLKVETRDSGSMYVDLNSIYAIREEGPYLVLGVKMPFINYNTGKIVLIDNIAYYNLDDRSRIEGKTAGVGAYDFDGTFRNYAHVNSPKELMGYGENDYVIANTIYKVFKGEKYNSDIASFI